MQTRPELILASSSPRRQELLRRITNSFRIVVPDIEEAAEAGETPDAFARRAALDKAMWVADHLDDHTNRIIIAADTIVVLDGQILGKPRGVKGAADMLHALSGKTHEVITGLTVMTVAGSQSKQKTITVKTKVKFKRLRAKEIAAYIATGEPMDKAGAYGIQGGANYMVRSIRGSYTNVVGLPMSELVDILTKDFDYPPV